jgi:hypothetical protein
MPNLPTAAEAPAGCDAPSLPLLDLMRVGIRRR